jgi:hypothetical protein
MAKIYTDTLVKPAIYERICNHLDIDNLRIGDGCKIKNSLGERFWVIFTDVTSNGDFIGIVNNELILPSDYNSKDKIQFTKSDIWDIMSTPRREIEKKKIIDIIMKFYLEHGRRPTYDEIMIMNTKITFVK